MSDKICPKCNNEVEKDSKFCPNCGFSLDNQKNDADEIINNFINFKDDITSKIQNKLENEDILNTNDIKEMIKNLDEDSLKQLMEKHGISPSRFKLLNFNKLFDKVDINRLKDDLIELGIINPKPDSDVETVKAKVIIEDDDVEEEPQKPQENEVPLIGTENIDIESSKEETEEKKKKFKTMNNQQLLKKSLMMNLRKIQKQKFLKKKQLQKMTILKMKKWVLLMKKNLRMIKNQYLLKRNPLKKKIMQMRKNHQLIQTFAANADSKIGLMLNSALNAETN